MKIFYIDNFDSFTYNNVSEFQRQGFEVEVFRSDVEFEKINSEIKKNKPELIVIGSGSSLKKAKVSVKIIQEHFKKIPILGIGLGNECIVEAFGGVVGKAPEISFGKPYKITHDNKTIFKKIDKEFRAGVYHSLVAVEVPYCLEVSSRTKTGTIMSIRHKDYLVEGIQFNPGSILTPLGGQIIENLLEEVKNR